MGGETDPARKRDVVDLGGEENVLKRRQELGDRRQKRGWEWGLRGSRGGVFVDCGRGRWRFLSAFANALADKPVALLNQRLVALAPGTMRVADGSPLTTDRGSVLNVGWRMDFQRELSG